MGVCFVIKHWAIQNKTTIKYRVLTEQRIAADFSKFLYNNFIFNFLNFKTLFVYKEMYMYINVSNK